MNETLNLILQICQLAIILIVVGFLAYKAWKVLRPLFKNPEFMTLILEKVAEAEVNFVGGGKKLGYVSDALVEYCEDNNIKFTRHDLEMLVNLVVAGANVVKNFINKKK